MGIGTDDVADTAQPVQDSAAPATLLDSVKQGDKSDQASADDKLSEGEKADLATATQVARGDATADQGDETSTGTTEASQADGEVSSQPTNTSTDTSSTASTDTSNDESFSSKLVNFLKKDYNKLMSDPNLFQSMMASGASTLAHANYGTSGASALGQGIQDGQKTYLARQQQQIMNNMAQLQYQRQAAKDAAAAKYQQAQTDEITNKVANDKTLRAYMANPGQAGITPQGILANGGTAETVKSYFPDMTVQHDDAGNVYSFNPRANTWTKIGTQSVVKNTPVTDNVNVYNGTGANGQPNATQVQTGGMAPAEISKAVQPYHEAQAKAEDQSHQYDSLMGALQTKAALSDISAQGGVLGAASRKALEMTGIYTDNSPIRQLYQRTNVTQEMSLLPPGARPNQFIEKQLTATQGHPENATAEQMLQSSAFNRVMAQVHAVDNAARAAYVSSNGGNEADLTKPTTITINGMQKTYGKGTSMQQVANDAKEHFVDYKPPIINPSWASGANVDDKAIQKALDMAKDPAKRKQLVKAGVLMKPIFGGE